MRVIIQKSFIYAGILPEQKGVVRPGLPKALAAALEDVTKLRNIKSAN